MVKSGNTAKKSNPITGCYGQLPNYINDDSIDMGTRFDCLDKSANLHYSQLSKTQQRNRTVLQQLMRKNGFKPYLYEWWHFTLENEPYPHTYFDFPVK